MGQNANQRAEIKAQLQAVSGIGNVFTDRFNPTDEKTFKDRLVVNSVINFCEISLAEGTDDADTAGTSFNDEQDDTQQTTKTNYWLIELFYGYHYDATTPSENIFQDLIEAIENKFRFLQDLNAKADQSYPLQRTSAGLWQMVSGTVLCHKASWKFQVQTYIKNTN